MNWLLVPLESITTVYDARIEIKSNSKRNLKKKFLYVRENNKKEGERRLRYLKILITVDIKLLDESKSYFFFLLS